MQANDTVIALVGKPAAGKSAVAAILAERWKFDWIKTRDIVLALSGPPGEKASLQVLGEKLMTPDGAIRFAEAVKEVLREGFPAVIDSIRPESHHTALLRTLTRRIWVVAIIASPDIRRLRFQRRARESELEWEARNAAVVESEVPRLIELADYAIANQVDDMSTLNAAVDRMLDFVMQGESPRALR